MKDLLEGVFGEFAERAAQFTDSRELTAIGFRPYSTLAWVNGLRAPSEANRRMDPTRREYVRAYQVATYDAKKDDINAKRRARYAAKKAAIA